MGIAASKKLAGDFAWPEGFNRSDVIFVCRRGVTPCTDAVEKIWPKAKIRQFDDDTTASSGSGERERSRQRSRSHPGCVKWTYRYPDAPLHADHREPVTGDEAFGIRVREIPMQ